MEDLDANDIISEFGYFFVGLFVRSVFFFLMELSCLKNSLSTRVSIYLVENPSVINPLILLIVCQNPLG